MNFNFARQLRTAGGVVLMLTPFFPNWYLIIFGFGLIEIGMVLSVDSSERRLDALEEQDAEKKA